MTVIARADWSVKTADVAKSPLGVSWTLIVPNRGYVGPTASAWTRAKETPIAQGVVSAMSIPDAAQNVSPVSDRPIVTMAASA